MKYPILFILRLLLLWLLFFSAQRLLFIIHYLGDFTGSFSELIAMPFYALRMDLSSFAYGMGIPFIFLAFSILLKDRAQSIFIKITHGLIWFFTLLFSILFSSELVSYYEWRTKLSSKIFVHFETPSEVFRTSSGAYTGWFILYLVLQLIIFYFLYKWLILRQKSNQNDLKLGKRVVSFLTYILVGTFLFGMALRGGLQAIPISATNTYYSKKQIVNDLAVNSIWNFIHMTFQHFKKDIEGMYNRLDPDYSDVIVDELYSYTPADTVRIFTTSRPNIIFVTLESWSGQVVGALGNPDDITPNFDALCKEGVLFTNMYATSGTSETGHTSIFSGYPTVPGISISSESAKCRQLSSIFGALKTEGYLSSYYFGGALAYGNIGGYLTEMEVDRQTDELDLDLNPKGDLGIHDEAMFPYFLSELSKAKPPYIYGLFTQSTHAPYDMPMGALEDHPKNREGFVNSLVYADRQVKLFTDALRTDPEFDNTIVIFIADHGKTNYVNGNVYSDDFYHIPLLIWGGAIKNKMKGLKIKKIGSQSDVAKTLLNQMDLPTQAFHWSKNLLDPNAPSWALLTSTMSFGIVDKTGYAAYHTIDEGTAFTTYTDNDSTKIALKRSRALVESIYREFRQF
ncbi:MAG: LTA synthase family protein [Crocinitomicaceae bacterium]